MGEVRHPQPRTRGLDLGGGGAWVGGPGVSVGVVRSNLVRSKHNRSNHDRPNKGVSVGVVRSSRNRRWVVVGGVGGWARAVLPSPIPVVPTP